MSNSSLMGRIAAGEGISTEFKLRVDAQIIGKTVCAFLNGEGGTVFCGVAENGDIAGLSGDVESIANELELSLKEMITPRPFLTAGRASIGDAQLLLVQAPKGADGPYAFNGGIWLRSGERTRAANIEQLKMLLRESIASERWELQPSPMMEEEYLDIDEIRATVRLGQERSGFTFSDPDDNRLVLKDLSMLASAGFNNAGDVLFSNMPTRRHPQCRVHFVRFASDKSDAEYLDNRWFEGPLVRICAEVINAVTSIIPQRSTFAPGEIERQDRQAYDTDAIREGVVNAFVHRDYSAYSGGLKISMYPDRIEIWNSGSLPDELSPSDLRHRHDSILINPNIAQVFYLRGLMEKVGRGTELIVKASRRLGSPLPTWRQSKSGVTLNIFAAALDPSDKPVNKRQQLLVDATMAGDTISLREYQERFANDVSERQARRDLAQLVDNGILSLEGAGPATLYRRR